MGQRMQVVFQIENDKEGRTNVAYHLQWGIGRITPLFIMQALIRADQMTHGSSVVNVFNHAETVDAIMCNDMNEYKGFTRQLQKYDFRDLTQAGEWFEHQDNNNGGAIVYVKTKYDEWGVEKIEHISVVFLKGWEDCRDGGKGFDKFLSYDEYANIPIHKRFCDQGHFNEMFKEFLNYIAK